MTSITRKAIEPTFPLANYLDSGRDDRSGEGALIDLPIHYPWRRAAVCPVATGGRRKTETWLRPASLAR